MNFHQYSYTGSKDISILVILTQFLFWSVECTNARKKLGSILTFSLSKYSFQKCVRLASNKRVAQIYILDPTIFYKLRSGRIANKKHVKRACERPATTLN